jgi:hypothetical protein
MMHGRCAYPAKSGATGAACALLGMRRMKPAALAASLGALLLIFAATKGARADGPTSTQATTTAVHDPEVPDFAPSSLSTTPRVSRVPRVWYGWQTLTTDGASLAALGLAAVSDSNGAQQLFAIASLTGFSLGAPIVHAAHGHWGIAGADFAMRVGGTLLGALTGFGVGAAAGSCSGSGCFGELNDAADGMVVGAALGLVAASAIDAAVLAHETVRSPASDSAFSFRPSVKVLKGGASAGVGGTF